MVGAVSIGRKRLDNISRYGNPMSHPGAVGGTSEMTVKRAAQRIGGRLTPDAARAQARRLLASAIYTRNRRVMSEWHARAFELAQIAAVLEEERMTPPPQLAALQSRWARGNISSEFSPALRPRMKQKLGLLNR